MDLPSGLSDIPHSRRQRLLERANMELESSGFDDDSGVLSSAKQSVTFVLLLDLFCILLWLELKGIADFASWSIVFIPLWVLDIQQTGKEVGRWLYFANHPPMGGGQPYTHPAILSYRILHNACMALTKIFMTVTLDNPDSTVLWTVIFIPMYVDAVVGVLLLQCHQPPPHVVETGGLENYNRGVSLSSMAHLLAWGLQPLLIALKLDEYMTCGWNKVLLPALLAFIWVILIMVVVSLHLLAGSCPMMCNYARLPHGGRLLLGLMVLTMLLTWGWVATLYVSYDALDNVLQGVEADDDQKKGEGSIDTVLLPIIIMLGITAVVLPFLVHLNRTVGGLDGNPLQPQPRVTLSSLSSPIQILRLSSTYFQRLEEQVGANIEISQQGSDIEGGSPKGRGIDLSGTAKEMMSTSGGSLGNKDVEKGAASAGLAAADDAAAAAAAAAAPSSGTSAGDDAAAGSGGGGGDGSGSGALMYTDDAAAAAGSAYGDDGTPLCFVCETNRPNAVILDCGHGGLCYDCAQGLLRTDERGIPLSPAGAPVCPICREPIQHVIKLPDGVFEGSNMMGGPFTSAEGISVKLTGGGYGKGGGGGGGGGGRGGNS